MLCIGLDMYGGDSVTGVDSRYGMTMVFNNRLSHGLVFSPSSLTLHLFLGLL
jgi:hypothetical protein